MSSILRRPTTLGVCLAGCAMTLAAVAGPTSAAARKAPAKAAAATQTAKGKIATFVKGTLELASGKKFKLDEKSKVLTRRGATGQAGWALALCPGDDVVVTYDKKRTLSVKVAPPMPLPGGQFAYLQRTKYAYTNPKTQETQDIPLLWLKSAKGRFVVELTDATVLTGEGVTEAVTGGQAIIDALQQGCTVEITPSSALPTIDKYGDPETVVRVNGVAKAVKVVSLPAAG